MLKLTLPMYAAAAGIATIIIVSSLLFFTTNSVTNNNDDGTASQPFDPLCHLQHFLTNTEGDCNSRNGTIPSPFDRISDSFNNEEQQQEEQQDYYLRGAADENSPYGKQLSDENKKYLCGDSIEKNNEYMKEYLLPYDCSQPVALAIDKSNNVWIAATWSGYLLVFDTESRSFIDSIEIPSWKAKGIFGSMVWGMEFDKESNLWFTDPLNNAIWKYFVNEQKFEIYKIPTVGSYPSQIAIDSQGKVWFSEIFGKKLGMVDPEKAVNNTTQGVEEYELKDIEFETMGPITIVEEEGKDVIWLTAVAYPAGGDVVKFDIEKKTFTVFSLPARTTVPIGIAVEKEDDKGEEEKKNATRLWVNDHNTNLFFVFEPSTGKITKYSTSPPTSRNNTTTLPYWNVIRDGKLWFNEHEGNVISYFDLGNLTLVEYQIPTRPQIWGNTSNPLKFAIDNKGSVWFTEWTENRIGVLESEKIGNLSLWLDVSENKIELDTKALGSRTLEVFVYPNGTGNLHQELVKMVVAGSMSPAGRLLNVTAEFSEDTFYFPVGKEEKNEPYKVTLKITPTKDLVQGNSTVTIGARYGNVTYSKILDLIAK